MSRYSPARAQGFEPAPRRPSPPAAPSSGPPSVHYSLGGYAPSLALPSKGTVGSGGSPRLPLSSSSPFSSPYGGAVGGSNSAAAPHHHQSLEYLQRYKSFGTAEYRTAFGITALAEAILHRVLSELPERPLQLMAAVCKEWSDAAFVEAEALYGEAAAAAGRSTSPGAAPSPYAALNAVLGDGMKGSSSGANNNSLSSPSQQQRARSTSAGGSPIHIVGGRPSQPRAPSITAVTPDGGVAIAHPPVLPWVRARPAVPPSLINIGGVGGGGGGGGLTSAGSTSSTSGGRYSASAYGGGGGGGLRVRSPSSAGGSRGLAAARGGLAVGSTAAAPIAPYWAVAGSGGSGLSGGALKSNSGGGGESAEVLRQRRLAGALGAPSSSSPQPTAVGGTSGGGNGSAFTYACRDYVQRHRVACIIDDWLFAITAQKPYSPALFSHNYFRQRHRMRHAVRREAALGTQLTTEEKERARVAALRRRASAASAAAGEKGDANSKQSPLSDDSDDAKEGGAADDAVPQLSRRASTRSATGGGGSGVWPSSPAAANKGGAAAGGGDGYGLEATSHVVAAAAVRRPTDTDGAATPTLNGAGASRGGDVPTASLMYANAQPKRAPLAFATAAPKAAEPAAVGANSGASPASPASPLGPTPGPSDGIWPSTPNALNNTPMPIGEGIPANVVTFSRPDPSAFESTSAAAAMLPGDGGGATAPPSVDMLAGGYAAVSPITPAPSAIPLAPTQGGEEFGDDIVSARSSPGAALDSAAVAPLSMASGAWGADVGPS